MTTQSTSAELRLLLAGLQFRRLLATRLTSQVADGIFQGALASYVLFSPEHQPDAASLAAALAAVLLPFTLVGPFAGVFLDRWNRRQILFYANVVRLVPVAATAAIIGTGGPDFLVLATVVVALGINRFFLAGLSASLPRVVPRDQLVLANSVTPTSGTIAYTVGLGIATALRHIGWPIDHDVAVTLIAAVVYACAAGLALRIPRMLLGPDNEVAHPRIISELGKAARGLRDGLDHLRARRPAAAALAVVSLNRFLFGLTTVSTVLLFRNYFNPPSDTDAGLAGLSKAILVSGIGFVVAAVITPIAVRRVSRQTWIVALLCLAGLCIAFPAPFYTQPSVLVTSFVIALSSQGIKICVDTIVQTTVDDAFRGRVFSVYDVLFNLAFVAAAAVGALVLPTTGKSYAVLAAIAVAYALLALWYGKSTRGSAIAPVLS